MYRHSEFSHNGHSMDGYDLNGVFSNAALEGNKTEAGSNPPAKTMGTASLFAESATLMENDLEAISALHSLSNHSPAQSRLPNDSDRQENAGRKGVERKSLFAKVVGSVKDKEKSGRKKRKPNR
jgi:hypothetical protein